MSIHGRIYMHSLVKGLTGAPCSPISVGGIAHRRPSSSCLGLNETFAQAHSWTGLLRQELMTEDLPPIFGERAVWDALLRGKSRGTHRLAVSSVSSDGPLV